MKLLRFWTGVVLLGLPVVLTADAYPMQNNLFSLQMISRQDWNALPPDFDSVAEHGLYNPVNNLDGWMVYDQPLREILRTVIVHHSALDIRDGPYEIQQLHFNMKGYADIAYHFVIDAEGNVYEGRDIYARGAHTGGYNTGSVGVVLLGNFEVINPTQAQIDALTQLLIVLKQEYQVTHLAGHRDFQPNVTVCPGVNLANQLPEIAAMLDYRYGMDGYQGP
ncbi:MAG: N-acetylmuramoyl-L-alanine amidase [Anaerolineaceae bacterium]|nr:N-acetylmuramoyl-L-alanine amidase [Anaerolineaceae bacterium]